MRAFALLFSGLLFCAALPASAVGAIGEARSLIDDGRLTEARGLLERATVPATKETERLLLLTRACNGLEDYECGVESGERLVELAPESTDAHYALAVALRIKLQKISKIKAMWIVGNYKSEFRRAIELDPRNLDAREEEIGFLSNAPVVVGGDKKEARRKIDELKAIDWRRGMVSQAGFEFEQELDDDAVRTLESVLEKHPDDTGSRFSLAFWLQRQQRYTEADEHFARLIDSDERAVALSALYQRARTRILGRFEPEQAVQQLKTFLESPAEFAEMPSKAAAYWRLGNAYEQLSDKSAARRAYEKALDLDPDIGEARKDLEALGG